MKTYEFDAIYKKVTDLNAGYIEIPFDVEIEFGAKRVKVLAHLDGVPYRGSLVRMETSCHILGIPKVIRQQIGRSFGETIHVVLQQDREERKVVVPSDFNKALQDADLTTVFQELSYTKQKEIITSIINAKKLETRLKRIDKALEVLRKKTAKKANE